MKPRIRYRFTLIVLLAAVGIAGFPRASRALYSFEGKDWRLKFTGYYKNIIAYSEPSDFPVNLLLGIPENPYFDFGSIEDPEHWDEFSRLRLKLELGYRKTLSGGIEVEQRGLAVRPDLKLGGFFASGGQTARWLDMDATIYDEPGYTATVFVDRLWAKWTPSWGEFVIGRQAITWTVGRIWFPTDRFGPFLPFDVEQDEKRGVDAANLAINLGDLGEFRIIYAPLEERSDDRIAARLMGTVHGFDVHLMGGYFQEDYVGGLSVAHNVFGWVARTEIAYTHPLDNESDRWTLIAGADGALPKNIYAVVEYLHQSAGAADPGRYFETMPLFISNNIFGLAQDYAGFVLRGAPRPEISISAAIIVNLNDGSSFYGPKIEYSPRQNITVALAANIFAPYLSGSEYGLFPNAYYATFKGFF